MYTVIHANRFIDNNFWKLCILIVHIVLIIATHKSTSGSESFSIVAVGNKPAILRWPNELL